MQEHAEKITEKTSEKWTIKAKEAQKKYKIGIMGEYEAFREIACPVMTNVAHGGKDVYCCGPRCGYWSTRLNMCGIAANGESAWCMLEYNKDYQATMEFYRKKEEESNTLKRINELANIIHDHFGDDPPDLPPSQMQIWINEIIKLTETKEETEEDIE